MTKLSYSRLPGAAIAAVLVLGTTPAFAQEAADPAASAPAIVLPPATVEPAPAPAPIVLPSAATDSSAASAPTARAEANAAQAPAKATRAEVSKRTARATSEAAAPVAPTVASDPASPAAPAEPESTVPAAVDSAPAAATIAPTPADDSNTLDEALMAGGLLAALGLGGLAFLMRRRRTRAVETTIAPAVVMSEPPRTFAVREPIVVPQATPPAAASIGPVAMPARVPTDQNERRALIDRMIAAEPDADNPFRTRKARMRRARLILGRMEQAELPKTPEPAFARAETVERTRQFEPA